jgi:hypothetical protein
VDAKPAPDVYDDGRWEVAGSYRVTLWEQPARPTEADRPQQGWSPLPGAPTGWQATSYELEVQDVREAIEWAEAIVAAEDGSVRNREYVIYARARDEDRWLQVAGRVPVLPRSEG